MSATTRVSSAPANTPRITVTEKGSCIPRIAKIAVPILGSLISFVFLPFLAAAAFTIGTTVAVMTYFGNANPKPAEASKEQPVFSPGTTVARIYFNSHEEKQQFATQHKSHFPDFAEFEVENKKDPSICISLKDPKHANRVQQMAQIQQIFSQTIAQ